MMAHEEEYGDLLKSYKNTRRGLPFVLERIAGELEDFSAMAHTARNSIEANHPDEPSERVLLLAGNKAFQLQKEVEVLSAALEAKAAGGEV